MPSRPLSFRGDFEAPRREAAADQFGGDMSTEGLITAISEVHLVDETLLTDLIERGCGINDKDLIAKPEASAYQRAI
ncbi:MAG: hypothetical protein ACR2OZ_06445 [Verrucomicrobiales bacterium]